MSEPIQVELFVDGKEASKAAASHRPTRSLPDIGRYHSRNTTDTEKAAAQAIASALSPQRVRVLSAFRKAGSAGLTDYEGHALARLTYPHIFATRRSELMAAGYPIVDSNERRQTPSGRLAIVWKLVFNEEDGIGTEQVPARRGPDTKAPEEGRR